MSSITRAGWLSPETHSDVAVAPFIYWEIPDCTALKDTIVIVLPPIGPEYMHCHRTLKRLSHHLVRDGLSCIRIDYPGYGNSADNVCFFNFDLCVSHIVHTIDTIKQTNPSKKISLLSLRSASLLAACVADIISVDSLIFWYPYLNGAAFIRDMQLIDSELSLEAQADFIEAGGYPIESSEADKIKAIKLSDFTYKNINTCLILINGEQRTNTRFLEQLRALDVDAFQLDCIGLSDMARQAELSTVPIDNIGEIAGWLNTHTVFDNTAVQAINNEAITLSTLNEQALWFECKHEGNNGFGILTLPNDKKTLSECEHVCLLGNAGSGHHVGPNRLHTQLARALAAHNVATIRYDLNGLGESNSGDDAHPYPSDASITLSIIIDLLAGSGIKKVSLAGLCSGAYHAFQAALTVKNNDIKIERVLLINPLFFYWQPGDSIFAPESQSEEISKQYYANQARDMKKWLAVLLSPQKWLNITSFIIRFIIKKIVGVFKNVTALIVGKKRSQLAKDMSAILANNIAVNLFMAEDEPGLLVLDSELDEKVNLHKQFQMTKFVGTDHTFSNKTSREQLISSLVKTVKAE